MKSELYSAVCSYIDSHYNEMLSFWKDLVNHKSYVREPEDVNNTVQFVKSAFEAEGFKCEEVDVGENCGHSLKCVYGEDRSGKPIIFSGHMDTVFPRDAFEDNPFHMEGDLAYGPGCLDMKGGIAIALFVCKALNEIGYCETPLKVLLSGNEENAHSNSTGNEFFLNEAGGGRFAFNMETGLKDGSVCNGRKGCMQSEIEITGREAHAGNDFISGRSAIEEMAHKILAFQSLTNLDVGTTVNVGVINGGTVVNAVPEKCTAKVDMRFTVASELDRLKSELDRICNENHVPDVTVIYKVTSLMPSYETNAQVDAFYDFVTKTAAEYGLTVPGHVYLGGSSDASWIQKTGTPVLCSCGVYGEWNHTRREYAIASSMRERCKLICACILEQANFF